MSLVALPVYATLPRIALDPLSEGEIVSPVVISNAGDGSHRLFVADQRGTIHVFQNGNLLATPFLDIGSKLVTERNNFDERGLLGLAFHPNFGQSGVAGEDKFYVYYSAPSPNSPGPATDPVDHQSVIAEYSVTGPGSNLADVASERILLTFDQPQFNHNAGHLEFGPDGLLYVMTGDGGGGGDNEPGHTGGAMGDPMGGLGNAQDRSKLLGKVLRIDVDGNNGPGGEYGIPATNPFVGEAGVREEIYAYGLRNPFRGTFDGDRLIVADVGQGLVEEVNIIQPGGNFGWRIKEGTFDFDNTVLPNPNVPLIDPIAEYAHPNANIGLPELGISVTGGIVYRGSASPQLEGAYLFGDFSNAFAPANGVLLALEESSPGVFDPQVQVLDVVGGNPLGQYVLTFGRDENGEVYVATKTALAASGTDNGMPTGAIYRVAAIPEPTALILATLAMTVYCLYVRTGRYRL
jgi:glucose/arabinose dehydrogenase